MESTSISDVRRMCQRGAFRAYVQGGKVFLEDTATGQVVPLNGESGPANTERRAVPHRKDRRGSRVERMFGARDTWKSADPDEDQGPYQEQKQEITAMLKRRNITKQEVDSVYGIAEVGRK